MHGPNVGRVTSTGALPVTACNCTADVMCHTCMVTADIGGPSLSYVASGSDISDMCAPMWETHSDGSHHAMVGGRLAGSELVPMTLAPIVAAADGTVTLPNDYRASALIPLAIDTAGTAAMVARETDRQAAARYVNSHAVNAEMARQFGKWLRTGRLSSLVDWDAPIADVVAALLERMPVNDDSPTVAKTARGKWSAVRRASKTALARQAAPAPLIRTVRTGTLVTVMPSGKWRPAGSRGASGRTIDASGRVTALWTATAKYKRDHSHITLETGNNGKGRPSKVVAEVWDYLTIAEQERIVALRGSISKSRKARSERDAIVETGRQRMAASNA